MATVLILSTGACFTTEFVCKSMAMGFIHLTFVIQLAHTVCVLYLGVLYRSICSSRIQLSMNKTIGIAFVNYFGMKDLLADL